jgi:hypothetical protein
MGRSRSREIGSLSVETSGEMEAYSRVNLKAPVAWLGTPKLENQASRGANELWSRLQSSRDQCTEIKSSPVVLHPLAIQHTPLSIVKAKQESVKAICAIASTLITYRLFNLCH